MTEAGEATHGRFPLSTKTFHMSAQSSFPKDAPYSWVVCAAAFTVQVVTIGVLNSFGVIFVELLEEFKASKAEISWIGSLAFGLSLGLGPISGALRLRFGTRIAICLGGFICSLSLLASSFVSNTKVLFGTFSLLYAIGGSLIINSTTILPPDYFEKYMSVATGIIVAGSSFGTLLFSFLSEIWVESVGWRRTFQIYSGISVLTIFMGLVVRPVRRPLPRPPSSNMNISTQAQSSLHVKLWENRVYVIWVTCVTSTMFGYYIPYVHLISYVVGLGMTKESGSVLIMVLGGTSAVARLLFGKVLSFQCLNRRQLHQLSLMITATSTMMVPISTSFGALLVYVIVQGLVDGCNVVIVPLLTAAYAGDSKVPIAWGILNGFSSITFTLGPPVAGWLYDATGSYNVSFHIAGIPVIMGAAVLFFIPWAQRTQKKVPPLVNVGSFTTDSLDGDGFTSADTPQVIVGLPVREASPYRLSGTDVPFANESNNIRNQYVDEEDVLNEDKWGWSCERRVSSMDLEIHPPQSQDSTVQKAVLDGGLDNTAGESSDRVVFVTTPNDSQNEYPNNDVCAILQDEETGTTIRPTSPILIPDSVVETLVELNENEDKYQPAHTIQELVQIHQQGGMKIHTVEDTENINISEENPAGSGPSPDEGAPPQVVIPDYVVEKLVELNENEQNKTNSDAAVDTLVHLGDTEEDINGLAVQSGVNQLLEVENNIATEKQADIWQSSSGLFSRQPSESQCILPSSVIETLKSLAQNDSELHDETQGDLSTNIACKTCTAFPDISGPSALSNSVEQQAVWPTEPKVNDSPSVPIQNYLSTRGLTTLGSEVLGNDLPRQNHNTWSDTGRQVSSLDQRPQVSDQRHDQSQWHASSDTVGAVLSTVGHSVPSSTQPPGLTTNDYDSTRPSNLEVTGLTPTPIHSLEIDGWQIVENRENFHEHTPGLQKPASAASHTSIREHSFGHNTNTASASVTQWRNTDRPHTFPLQTHFPDCSDIVHGAPNPSSSPQVFHMSQQQVGQFSSAGNPNPSYNTWGSTELPMADKTSHTAVTHPPASGTGMPTINHETWWPEKGESNLPIAVTENHTRSVDWCLKACSENDIPLTNEPSPHSLHFLNGDTLQASPHPENATNPFIDTNSDYKPIPQEQTLSQKEGPETTTGDTSEAALEAFDQLWTKPSNGTDTERPGEPAD